MKVDPRRLRPAELLALGGGVLLAVAPFLPWYELAGGRENAWSALIAAAIPAALAAVLALALVLATLAQRSPGMPLVLAVCTTLLALLSSVLIVVSAIDPPAGTTSRCYGLWLGLAGSVAVLAAAWLSLRDERPFWGVPVSR